MPFYTLYGWRVRSALDLPEAAPAGEGEADITILRGAVPAASLPAAPDELGMVWDAGWCGIRIPGVGGFLVEDGRRVTLDLDPGADAGEVRAYLLGSVLAVALHQRALLPLHVSAVLTPRGVLAFTGDSGAGKSTLASRLNRRFGWPLVCDDVGVVKPGEGAPLLHGGPRRMKLWKDALAGAGAQAGELTRDIARFDKFLVDRPAAFHGAPASLRHLIVLERGEEIGLVEIDGLQKFAALVNAVYRPNFGRIFNDQKTFFETCTQLAGTIKVWRLARPWSDAGMVASLELIGETFGEV